MKATSKVLIGFGILVISAALLPGAVAGSDWKVRFGLEVNSPTGDLSSGGQTTELDSAVGIFASAEMRVNDRFGIEPGLNHTSYDIETKQTGFPTIGGDVTALGLTLNGNFHLTPNKNFDFYIGPTVGYMFWDSIDNDLIGTIPTEDEFAIGANAGIDLPIGDSAWSFAVALRYLANDLAVKGGSDIGVDPVQVKAGLACSFGK